MAEAGQPQGVPAPMAAVPGNTSSGGTAHNAKGAKKPGADEKLKGDHMLIFTGAVTMEVDRGDISTSIDKVVDLAADVGGYVSKQDNHSVAVRVPSKSFRSAMRAMQKLGDVTQRSVQAQDVSEEFHDLGVRLKSLRATRARLEKFLDRAKTIQEALRVEQELTRLNGQIDRIEGRMRFLGQRVSFSTITVTFTAKPKTEKVVAKKDPPPPRKVKPKTRPLPIDWLARVGIDHLLDLHRSEDD